MHLVLAASVDEDRSWVADATAAFAVKTGATVAVVSVDEVELERLAPVPRSVFSERAAAAAAAAADRLTAAGVQATSAVRSGLARDQILAFAEQERADVIVVGASARPAVATRLLGSTPLALVARSSRPVLVVTRPPDASA
jgi:nucleotide-binding universal stress UspA family protein